MAFYLYDIPAEPFTIEPPQTIILAEFTEAAATLRTPDGSSWGGSIDAEIIDDVIVVTLDGGSPFLEEGIYELRILLSNVDTLQPRQRIPAVRIVAQDQDSEWHTLDSIREEWADAEHIPDPQLWELLELVKGQVLEFAPVLAEGAPVPLRYRQGQRVQARNTWNATKVSPDGGIGEGDFIIRPFPLDWHVKAILRPKRGVPVVG